MGAATPTRGRSILWGMPPVVPVRPPSPAGEAARVVGALAFLWAGVLATGPAGPEAADTRPALEAHQRRFEELAFGEQATVRDLVAALDEMTWILHEEGRWPGAGRLAEDWVGPFLPEGPYAWEHEGFGASASYLGIPDGGTRGAVLLDVQESPAGADPRHEERLLADGRHRRLPDGRVVHFTVWVLPPETTAQVEMPMRPAMEGWREVVLGDEGEAAS